MPDTLTRYSAEDVRRYAFGRWKDIMTALAGFHPEHMNGRGFPCPSCGGDDRFNTAADFSQTGSAFCRGCQLGGDGFSVLMKLRRWTFPQALYAVGEFLNAPAEQVERAPCHDEMAARLHERATSEGRLQPLSEELGVSVESLIRLRCGWNGEAWAFQETNAVSGVIGINRRFPDGQKKQYPGHKRGLMICTVAPSQHIYCVEGASDTAALIDERLKVIGRPSANGGAGHLVEFFRDRHVPDEELFIIGENDYRPGHWPGLQGAVSIGRKIIAAIPRLTVWVALPGDGAKDVRDWQARFPTGDFVQSLETFTVPLAAQMVQMAGGLK